MRGGRNQFTGQSGEELANQGQRNLGGSMWYKNLGANIKIKIKLPQTPRREK